MMINHQRGASLKDRCFMLEAGLKHYLIASFVIFTVMLVGAPMLYFKGSMPTEYAAFVAAQVLFVGLVDILAFFGGVFVIRHITLGIPSIGFPPVDTTENTIH